MNMVQYVLFKVLFLFKRSLKGFLLRRWKRNVFQFIQSFINVDTSCQVGTGIFFAFEWVAQSVTPTPVCLILIAPFLMLQITNVKKYNQAWQNYNNG